MHLAGVSLSHVQTSQKPTSFVIYKKTAILPEIHPLKEVAVTFPYDSIRLRNTLFFTQYSNTVCLIHVTSILHFFVLFSVKITPRFGRWLCSHHDKNQIYETYCWIHSIKIIYTSCSIQQIQQKKFYSFLLHDDSSTASCRNVVLI
jgi:hypothetical protein